MKLLHTLRCYMGHHQRSGSRARDDGTTMRSICRYCRKPMIRKDDGWVLDEPSSN